MDLFLPDVEDMALEKAEDVEEGLAVGGSDDAEQDGEVDGARWRLVRRKAKMAVKKGVVLHRPGDRPMFEGCYSTHHREVEHGRDPPILRRRPRRLMGCHDAEVDGGAGVGGTSEDDVRSDGGGGGNSGCVVGGGSMGNFR